MSGHIEYIINGGSVRPDFVQSGGSGGPRGCDLR